MVDPSSSNTAPREASATSGKSAPRSVSAGSLDGLRYFLHLLDAPFLYGVFVAAYWLRFESGWIPDSGSGAPPLDDYRLTFAAMALGCAAYLWSTGFYERLRFDLRQFFRLGSQLVVVGGISLALFFFRRDFSYSRVTILLSFAGAYLGLGCFHWFKSSLLLALMRRGYGLRPVAVVGPRDLALSCLARFEAAPDLPYRLLGSIGETRGTPGSDPPGGVRREAEEVVAQPYVHSRKAWTLEEVDLDLLDGRYPHLGSLEEIEEVVAREGIQELFVAYPLTTGPRLFEVLRTCENTTAAVRVVPDLMSIIAHGVRMRLVAGVPVLDMGRSAMDGVEGQLKRLLDLAGAGLGLLLLSPLLAFLAWMVKRSSPGPVLYEQERVGMDGRPFTIYKFRSMPVDAEASTGPVWNKQEDDRATSWGAFMRKWSLDELPQLWNVLRGDMSLVGPRPERPFFVNQFRQDIQGYMQRHKVKAGITGWAQINGMRGECPIESRTRYDVWYIENWSLALDLEILFRTLYVCAFHPDGN